MSTSFCLQRAARSVKDGGKALQQAKRKGDVHSRESRGTGNSQEQREKIDRYSERADASGPERINSGSM